MQDYKFNLKNMLHYSATVTSQGQITIPAKIRRALKLDKNRSVQIELVDQKMVIEPEPDILSLRGAFKTKIRIPFKKAREAFEEAMARGEV